MAPDLKNAKKAFSYKKRKKTIMKKAKQLAILCDVPVGLVCVNPDGTVETWPQEKEKVVDILKQYKGTERRKIRNNKNKKSSKDKAEKKLVFATWDTRFDCLTEEDLEEVSKTLDRKLQAVNQAIGKEQIGKERKIVHDFDVAVGNDDNPENIGPYSRNLIDLVGLKQNNAGLNSDTKEIENCSGLRNSRNVFSGGISGSDGTSRMPEGVNDEGNSKTLTMAMDPLKLTLWFS